MLRKMKADRIKRFHMERQGSAFSAVNRAASYSAIEGHNSMDELERGGTVKMNISTDYDQPSSIQQQLDSHKKSQPVVTKQDLNKISSIVSVQNGEEHNSVDDGEGVVIFPESPIVGQRMPAHLQKS